jgi:hypothetical protein
MKKISFLTTLTLLVFMTQAAYARSIYLNGFDISDVRDKRFEKATVVIDKAGNIRIEAPQYDVKVIPPKAEKYYLVTQPSSGGKAQYDFTVTVNGKSRKEIKAGSPQVIIEISAWLKKGENAILISAAKNLDVGRKSYSASDKAATLIGTGREENKIVKIDGIKGKLEVNASTTAPQSKKIILTAK